MVLHLTDQIAVLILHNTLAEITAKPPQQGGHPVLAAVADDQPAQDREAAAVFQLAINVVKRGGQGGKDEIVAREARPHDPIGAGHGGHGGVQFGPVAGR